MANKIFDLKEAIHFFKKCAIQHTDVAHNVLAEGSDGPEGEQSFHFLWLKDVLGNMRKAVNPNKVNVMLAMPNYKPLDDCGNSTEYCFTLLFVAHASVGDLSEECEAMVRSERVMWDFVTKLLQAPDEADPCCNPFRRISYKDFSRMDPVGPLWDNYFGWELEFCVPIDTSEWVDYDRLPNVFILPLPDLLDVAPLK